MNAGIGALHYTTGESARAASHIRVYCDQDKRWEPNPLQPGVVQDRVNKVCCPANLNQSKDCFVSGTAARVLLNPTTPTT